jgi:hypothetical protein
MDTATEAPGSTSAPEDGREEAASPSPPETSTMHAQIGGIALKLRLRFQQAITSPRDAPGSSPQSAAGSKAGPGDSGVGPAPALPLTGPRQKSGDQFPVNYGASTSGIFHPVRSSPPHEAVDDSDSDTSLVEPEDVHEEGEWTMAAVIETRVLLASALDDLDAAQAPLDYTRHQLTDLNTDMEVSLREASQRRLRVQQLDQQIARKTQDADEARVRRDPLQAERDEARAQRDSIQAELARLRDERSDWIADIGHLEEESNDLRRSCFLLPVSLTC